MFTRAMEAKLGELVEKFGLSAEQFGTNIDLQMRKNDVVDEEQTPEICAKNYLELRKNAGESCDMFPDVPSVLKGACNLYAQQLALDPAVRKCIRARYRDDGLQIATEPTALGKERIDETHKMSGIKRTKKPTAHLRASGEFLLMREAEAERLIALKLDHLDDQWRMILGADVDENFLSNSENLSANKWNELRKQVLAKLLDELLLPTFEAEYRAHLVRHDGLATPFVLSKVASPTIR
jgi:transcription elongation factor SPT6